MRDARVVSAGGAITSASRERLGMARREQVRSLTPLLELVVAARRTEKEQRGRRGISAMELALLRGRTLHALEDFAAALESLAWPVPRDMLQEMRLYRALLGAAYV